MKQTKDFVLILAQSALPSSFVHWEVDCSGTSGWKVYQIDLIDMNVVFDSTTVAVPVPADCFLIDIYSSGKRLDPALSTACVINDSSTNGTRAYDIRIPAVMRGETSRQTDNMFTSFPCFENPHGERIQGWQLNFQNNANCRMSQISLRLRFTYEEHGAIGSMFSMDAESFFNPNPGKSMSK